MAAQGPIDLVTGGAGFIGSHMVDALLVRGRRVRVIDNYSTGRPENLGHHASDPRLELIRGDINDAAALKTVLAGVERVFHFAALADIVPSIQNPTGYFRANVDGTFALVEAARAGGVRRFVYAASSSCYGLATQVPTMEAAPINPQYPYAITKYLGEQIALGWAATYGFPALSLRLFNVYGPRSRTSGTYGAVFGVFLAQLLAGQPLTIVGDGSQTRDFIFVTDVVRAFLAAADSDRIGRVYNVGANNPISINRLSDLLRPASRVHIPKRPGEPDVTHADTRRIRTELGWEPEVSFEVGVQAMLDNIDYWRQAPVWTVEKIKDATVDWFKYLGRSTT